MPMEVRSCPRCGALVVPQLARCRQCKTYLQGTRVEALLVEGLLPASLERAPGTALLVFALFLYYALMVVLTVGVDAGSVLGFSSFSLQQLGATHGPSVLRGQWWRFATSIFVHHDLMHLGFNVWSLSSAGPLVEQVFDRKKMLLIYLASGIASMVASHCWYLYAEAGGVLVTSGGASGAVCGMVGAAWFGARKLGPQGREVVAGMQRWALYLVVWGLLMPGINNAAHLGGFLVGALLAAATPAGLTQTAAVQRALSVLTLGVLGVVLASAGLMLANLRGYPAALRDDAQPRAILGLRYQRGVDPAASDQIASAERCRTASSAASPKDDALTACELAVRALPSDLGAYELAARAYERRGAVDPARRLRAAMRAVAAGLQE